VETQTIFYAIGIIFMSILILLCAVLIATLLFLRAKINRVQHMIERRIGALTNLKETAKVILKRRIS
jgi:hypothetical protein